MNKILETKSKNFASELQKVLKKRKSDNNEIEKIANINVNKECWFG